MSARTLIALISTILRRGRCTKWKCWFLEWKSHVKQWWKWSQQQQGANYWSQTPIKLAYDAPRHIRNIGNNECWQDQEYGDLLDRLEKANHESRKIFEGMRFATKTNLKVIVNLYFQRSNSERWNLHCKDSKFKWR